ncbi:metalloregulator ArsR/SmtB family transcription factor [Pelagicoccus sp. SDUM812002]|uniref:ArsR/SmtB family transcription factor n=1 Tax=Pelagicoccus sp. SDUM812002 TaxID=3041266 RepID=UPI00280C8E16|nr:metalloregulator ArsR/SmtB family transcription factor [Pelagicoccus sp. SDUM812002]MDQ8188308.1 metalloregulator ArsR/SmtB family transcription factor [Pelagicoccus sp. SDUM812002]
MDINEPMDCVSIYKSLAEESRLRILNLLRKGPLCVCHVQEALQMPQPKVSKQLAYLKKHGLLDSRRHNNWTIYEIAAADESLFAANLRELERVFAEGMFRDDANRLDKLDTSIACVQRDDACCEGECC